MSDLPTPVHGESRPDLTRGLALAVLRLWLGGRALVAGIEKYAGTRTVQMPLLDADGEPDISGLMIEVREKFYALGNYRALPETMETQLLAEPLLPGILMAPFLALLGPILLLLGLTLIAGIFTRWSLVLLGLLYTALTMGLVLLGQDAGVAWLGVHIALIGFALVLTPHQRFSITRT
ncbi:MAG: hypothetical protein EA425_08625 [Puniceicoccaceae bacterium]|nr:MAG: hypothetical protein EA425_08625 [Puniceicoccaceae bacterium]